MSKTEYFCNREKNIQAISRQYLFIMLMVIRLAVITALGDDERILYAEKGELYTKSKTFTTLNKYKIVIK